MMLPGMIKDVQPIQINMSPARIRWESHEKIWTIKKKRCEQLELDDVPLCIKDMNQNNNTCHH